MSLGGREVLPPIPIKAYARSYTPLLWPAVGPFLDLAALPRDRTICSSTRRLTGSFSCSSHLSVIRPPLPTPLQIQFGFTIYAPRHQRHTTLRGLLTPETTRGYEPNVLPATNNYQKARYSVQAHREPVRLKIGNIPTASEGSSWQLAHALLQNLEPACCCHEKSWRICSRCTSANVSQRFPWEKYGGLWQMG